MSHASPQFDALVIGAGHNGLIAACRLAGAGLKTLVLERRDVLGGLAATEEFHPGFRAPGPLHETVGLRGELVASLGLAARGLRLRDAGLPIAVPARQGKPFHLVRDPEWAAAELSRVSDGDVSGYKAYFGFIERVRHLVYAIMSSAPPPLRPEGATQLVELARMGLGVRRLGRDDMLELMRVAPMCAADWLGELFPSQSLRAALALPGVLATFQGPWSAGSAATLILHECTADREVVGGGRALIEALSAEATARGVTVRTGAAVTALIFDGPAVSGVRLSTGEEVRAPRVLASCDPRHLLLELVDAGLIPVRMEDQLRNVRCRGTAFKVNLAVSGPLTLRGGDGEGVEALRVAGDTVDDLERAFDAVKYGRFSERPALDVRVPSMADPTLAPAGHHVVSILGGFAPRELEGGWTPEAREALGDRAVAVLAEHVPDLEGRIVAREVLTPADIEARYGVTGGQIHHGEHALDQLLFMRPTPTLSRYEMPFPGLYLCGSGAHPGGGITGAPGWLGAGAALTARG